MPGARHMSWKWVSRERVERLRQNGCGMINCRSRLDNWQRSHMQTQTNIRPDDMQTESHRT
jgi:hypothetical protein